tara:strand:- start:404 stop:580 length:177 start_codon:yes stop_codon:yes gene_type:complete
MLTWDNLSIGTKFKILLTYVYIRKKYKYHIGGFIAIGIGVFVFFKMRKSENIQMTPNQ